eukprot:Awhi_evm1s12096
MMMLILLVSNLEHDHDSHENPVKSFTQISMSRKTNPLWTVSDEEFEIEKDYREERQDNYNSSNGSFFEAEDKLSPPYM